MEHVLDRHKVKAPWWGPLIGGHVVRCSCGWYVIGSVDGTVAATERHWDDMLAGKHVVGPVERWHWGLLTGLPARVRCSCGAWMVGSVEGAQEWREDHLREHSHG